MSTVWETRYRLLLDQLERLADRLGADQPPKPRAVEEQTVRLLTGVVRLLRQHRVNRRGQCRFCGWTRRIWRLGHRRPRCTAYRAVDLAMSQPLDVVWWQLLEGIGRKAALDEVREWLKQCELAAREEATAEHATDDDTVRLERTSQYLTRDQARSLWLHRIVAGRLAMDPDDILTTARANIHTLCRADPDSAVQQSLKQWQTLLDGSLTSLLDILTSTSVQAIELRENSPFTGVLSEQERRAALAAFRAHCSRDPSA